MSPKVHTRTSHPHSAPTPAADAPPLTVELRPTASLRPYPQNVKHHSADAVAALAEVIREVGFRVPIVVDTDGVIVKGHRGWLAARALGMDAVPVHVMEADPATIRAWRIRDNKEGERSEWDLAALGAEFRAMEAGGLTLEATGFDAAEVDQILGREGASVEPVAVLPLPVMTWVLVGIPTVRYGEVADLVDQLALLDDVVLEVTANASAPTAGNANA